MMGPKQKKKIEKKMRFMTRINTAIGIVSILAVVILFLWLRFFIDADLLHHDEAHEDDHTEEVHESDDDHDKDVSADSHDEVTPTLTEEEMHDLEDSYQSSINSTLESTDLSNSGNSQTTLDSVLEMKVPSTYQELHLSVVIALNSAVKGDAESAQQKIDELKEQYDWFLAE